MEIILCNRGGAVVDAWRYAFKGTPARVKQGDILDVQADAIVSCSSTLDHRSLRSLVRGWRQEKAACPLAAAHDRCDEPTMW
ncbi:MAG: hypothetical protein AAFV53_24915 [Myxococcota bacterium]